MRRSEAFPSRYIGKDDVKTPLLATIKELDQAMIKSDGGDECKNVMFFKDPNVKPLIVNTVNWMILEDAYGEESDDWHGKMVELYVNPDVMFGGKRVGGVRVRVPIAQQAAQQVSFDAVDLMSFSQAQAACLEVGIGKDTLIQSLKGKGHEGYNSERDTEHVLQIIQNVKDRPAVTVPAVPEDDIPF